MLVPIALGDLVGTYILRDTAYLSSISSHPVVQGVLVILFFTVASLGLIVFGFKETFVQTTAQRISFAYPLKMLKNMDRMIAKLSIIFLVTITGWSLFFLNLSEFSSHYYNLKAGGLDTTLAIVSVGLLIGWSICIPRVNNHLNPIMRFVLSKLVTILCVFTLLLIPPLSIFWALIFVIAICSAMAYVTLLGLFVHFVGDRHRGWVMGLASAIHFLAFAVAGAFDFILGAFPLWALSVLSVLLLSTSVGLILRWQQGCVGPNFSVKCLFFGKHIP